MSRPLHQLSFLLLAILMSAVFISAQTKEKVVHGGVVNGKALTLVKPAYPAEARSSSLYGEVKVEVVIAEDSTIIQAKAVSGASVFHSAAESAARKSIFSPTKLQGNPVKVTGVIVYRFIPPEPESYEEALKFMAIGLMFRVVAYAPAEFLLENPFADKEFAEFGLVPPALLKDLAGLTPKTPIDEKEKTLMKGFTHLKGTLVGDDLWQFELGLQIGETLSTRDETSSLEDRMARLRPMVSEINRKVITAPVSFPKPVLEKLRELRNIEEIKPSDEVLELVFVKWFEDLLEVISPTT